MAVPRIERGIDSGADADLENAIVRGDAHPFDRDEPAMVQCRAKPQVVPAGLLLVHARDEIGLDSGHRQGAGRNVGSEIIVFTVEQHAEGPPVWGGCPTRALRLSVHRQQSGPSGTKSGPSGTIAFSALSNKPELRNALQHGERN